MAETSESLLDNRFVSVRRTLGRPGLVRVSGKTTLFPALAEVTHAG